MEDNHNSSIDISFDEMFGKDGFTSSTDKDEPL